MRKIYAIQLSYEVPSEDKDKANKALLFLDYILKLLKKCDQHLDLMFIPFKNNPNVSPDQIFQARAGLRRYRDKVVDNFNDFKKYAFRTYIILQYFSSDTQIIKLNKSFVLSIDDIEKQVNRFVDLFSALDAKEFPTNIVKAIENIKKEVSQFEQIVEDRIISHIKDNILSKSWIDNISDELQEKVEKKIPLSIQLVNERNEKK